MTSDFLYRYKAVITDVYDGDTVTADIDLGMGVWLRGQRIRLYGINAPELRGDEREQGMVSRDWLQETVLGQNVVLRTHKDQTGKFGRWLAEIFLGERNINAAMVVNKLAREAHY
jgi:micrococcal nuclease